VKKIVNFWILHKINKVSDQLFDYNLLKKHFDMCGWIWYKLSCDLSCKCRKLNSALHVFTVGCMCYRC